MDFTPVILVLLIILAIALLELLLYSVPLRIRVRLEHIDETGTAHLSLLWLCLGIRAHLFRKRRDVDLLLWERILFSPQFPAKVRDPARLPGTGPEPRKKEISESLTFLESIIPNIPRILSFFRSAARSIYLEEVNCQATIGLASPAQTGIVYGYYWALRSMFPYSDRFHIVMIPDFYRERLDGHLKVDLMVRHPFALIIRLWHLYARSGSFPVKNTVGGDGQA